MPNHDTYSGVAALSICEALLLALGDARILPESEIIGLLEDAAASHENASGPDIDPEMHRAVAALIRSLRKEVRSARRI
ncbi:hypothetical protein [Flavimaricola marinus]|uniref:Uncharacterized protein n=1 Tax=Flavimaricola marinus TaxID=1819565 RepID=A0A238LHE8_9RHOB|nr:hypothetical protein [Flavimaricola marinus]SMY09119.1 hypothetical protein LOM8899_03281 [Flavimaricola marinus]